MSKAVQRMYTRIDRGYELVNHLFTLNLDRWWRRKAARLAAEHREGRWLDLCTGTGEMAMALAGRATGETRVFAVDFSLPMIRQARSKPNAVGVEFLISDAATLPFGEGTFDLVTISFATRNLESSRPLEVFFGEVHRILSPGGTMVHLETSQPTNPAVSSLFKLYVKSTIPPLGKLVTGAVGPYRFLASSVLRFHGAAELEGILTRAGFADVESSPLLLGAVAIHRAVK